MAASPSAASAATPSPAVPSPTAPRSTPHERSAHQVVALGDSVTAGTNCDCIAFPALFGRELAARDHVPAPVTNAGVPGETAADLGHDLQVDAALGRQVAAADVVVVTIGANDFGDQADAVTGGACGSGADPLACVQDELGQLGGRLAGVLAQVSRLRGTQPTTVLVTGYWNVFEDGDVAAQRFPAAGRAASDRLTLAANARIETAAKQAGDRYVDLYTPFKGERAERDPTPLLADDGDHPDAAGHRVIAAALLAADPAH